MTTTAPPVVLTTVADAHEAYRTKDLRQALYDAGEVVMSGVLVNLHGDEHRNRRRVWDAEFLTPSAERRRELLAREADGREVDVPRDVLTTLLRHGDELDVSWPGVRRDPANPPQRDAATARPYSGTYPVLLGVRS